MASASARAAIVTGGTRGIGRAVVRRLAAEGYAVALSGRTAKSAEEAVASFRKEGFSVVGLAADARKQEDQRRLVDLAEREFGRLDVLVNNAGIGEFGRVDEISPSASGTCSRRPLRRLVRDSPRRAWSPSSPSPA